MPWTDEAIMASVTQQSSSTLLLDVLTKMRGRCQLKVLLDGASLPPLYPGCTVKVTQHDAGFGEVPTAELHDASGGLENAETNLIGMTVLQAFRHMIEAFLPMYDPARNVYKAASDLMPVLRDEDERWSLYYLVWEMQLLSQLGHAGSLERCKGAFKHGETIYISPRNGKAASRAEAGAFLDRMIPVPGFLMGKKTASAPEIRQGQQMTTMLLKNFALPASKLKELPPQRLEVIAAMDELQDGVLTHGDDENFDEDSYRRRLLSLRTLRVAERSGV